MTCSTASLQMRPLKNWGVLWKPRWQRAVSLGLWCLFSSEHVWFPGQRAHSYLAYACMCVLLILSSVPSLCLVRMESWQLLLEVNVGVVSSTSKALTSKYGCHPQQGEEEWDYWIWTTLGATLNKGVFHLLPAVVRSVMMSSGVGGGIHMMALLCMTCSTMNSQNSWIARLTCLTWSIVTLSMMVIHGHRHVVLDNAVVCAYKELCCLFQFTRLASVWVLFSHAKRCN